MRSTVELRAQEMTSLRHRNPRTPRRAVRGVSLLEVLIAVLILAIGMLGIAALQALTLKNTQGSAERSGAVIQSYAMLDMMRANSAAARAGNYDQGWLCAVPEDGVGRIGGDIARWINQLKESVGPSACGQIDCGTVTCTIGVRWDASRNTGGPTGEDSTETEEIFTTVSRL
jgi:type IV pilus assembly protein PilV